MRSAIFVDHFPFRLTPNYFLEGSGCESPFIGQVKWESGSRRRLNAENSYRSIRTTKLLCFCKHLPSRAEQQNSKNPFTFVPTIKPQDAAYSSKESYVHVRKKHRIGFEEVNPQEEMGVGKHFYTAKSGIFFKNE